MQNKFTYLINKINSSEIISNPFPHLEIKNFFSENDFIDIINQNEIKLKASTSDKNLVENLISTGYVSIEFPGCIQDIELYLEWHKDKKKQIDLNNTTCSSFGLTFRLLKIKSPILIELEKFLISELFISSIAKKFNIDLKNTEYDSGMQKYLDGYEISPHPDVRAKALTYMVNVNPEKNSEKNNHHTYLLKFKDKYKYVETFWNNNIDKDRCWVPWDWCEIVKTHHSNNSILIFAPQNNSMHAVKVDYDHNRYQRTQLYGNLWYNNIKTNMQPMWTEFADGYPSKLTGKNQKKTYQKLNFFKKIINKFKNKTKFYNY